MTAENGVRRTLVSSCWTRLMPSWAVWQRAYGGGRVVLWMRCLAHAASLSARSLREWRHTSLWVSVLWSRMKPCCRVEEGQSRWVWFFSSLVALPSLLIPRQSQCLMCGLCSACRSQVTQQDSLNRCSSAYLSDTEAGTAIMSLFSWALNIFECMSQNIQRCL